MNPVEEFLAKEPLFRCDRLDASITRKQCAANKTRQENLTKDIWTCHPCIGCAGLGGQVNINQEVSEMASLCKIKGCTKKQQHGKDGLCCTHFAEANPKQPVVKIKTPPKPRPLCTHPECEKLQWRDGTCYLHLPTNVAKRQAKQVEDAADSFVDAVIDHVERAARVQVQEIIDRPADLPSIPVMVHAAGVRTIEAMRRLLCRRCVRCIRRLKRSG